MVPYQRLVPHETVPQECGAAPSGRESLAYADVPDSLLRRVVLRSGLRLAVSRIAVNGTYRVLGAPLTAACVLALAPGAQDAAPWRLSLPRREKTRAVEPKEAQEAWQI
ncbi:hypothetical protein [Streptomyces sp. NPDC091040]|uniref:hypothetical protein n=1 Tax=Streptomyces sp. NPDC091040 TaxID=3365972 RepID=UPI0038222AAD